jgi:hypothetical protein
MTRRMAIRLPQLALPRRQIVALVVFALATLVSFAPHLSILVFQMVGATPPAGLLLFCPLHHFGEVHHAATPAFQLNARPLVTPPST